MKRSINLKNIFKLLNIFIVKGLWYKMDGAAELKHLLVRIHFNTGHKANYRTQTNLFPALLEEKYKKFVFCTLKKDNTLR